MPITAKELLLSVGQRFTADIVGEKFELCVRGWHDGRYIIVDIPMYRNEPLTLATLTGCKILFVKDGTYIRFHSKIIRAFYQSPPFLVMSFPEVMDKTNLRKHERYQVSVPITFRSNGGALKEGLIRDLGMGGALITSALQLVKGDKITLSATLKLGSLKELPATVQNVREYTKNKIKYNAAGLKFLELSENDKKVIQGIIDFQKNQSSLLATSI